jgi:hypothetical protein
MTLIKNTNNKYWWGYRKFKKTSYTISRNTN